MDLELGGVIVNRIAKDAKLSVHEKQMLSSLNREALSPKDKLRLSFFDSYQKLAKREAEQVEILKKDLPPGTQLYEIPSFERDIYDISGLNLINLYLFR